MPVRESIIAHLEQHGSATSSELVTLLGISRQAINVHIKALITSGEIVKTGSTRGARYFPGSAATPTQSFSRNFDLAGLDEDRVYSRIATELNFKKHLRTNVESIIHYAFTEILNNAIDHSEAMHCHTQVSLGTGQLSFEVRESGIGIFRSIASKLRLEDEQAAMIELIKGKTTTMPEAHSGEGIFFTSRVADKFALRSHRIQLEWNRELDDVFVSTPRFRKGTTATFTIRPDSRTRLEDVFSDFAPKKYDYQFRKTRVLVKLLQAEYVSRSEAKRLLINLEKFLEIELDFRDVENLGQGFADEVFRVFTARNPGIEVTAVNGSANVDAMIRHARQHSTG
jgi:biotin operon repressor/anti-sigma regulatory factor (Ser/Thr protein kinase)